MLRKITHPLLAVPLGSVVIMVLVQIWAVFQTDRLVINQAFVLFLPALPLLATIYWVLYHRKTGGEISWNRLILSWLGSNVLGLILAVILFVGFHSLSSANTVDTYNYDHFGFSTYVGGRQRSVVEGEKALDAVLFDVEGRRVQLSSLWKQNPIALEFGSITCPVFVGKVPTMNVLADQYAGKIDFYVLYTREAHPGQNYPAHRSLDAKLQCAADLVREEGVGRTLLVDDVDGKIHQAYGAMPNSVYLIGSDGVIAHRADWVDPGYLEQQIDILLEAGGKGAAVSPTSLSGNFTQVDSSAMATALRVFTRAGLASGADFFLSFPNMVRGRAGADHEQSQ